MTTTTAPVDVNTAFATERRGQLSALRAAATSARERAERQAADVAAKVAAGTMRDLGNGRYQVTEGWDAGEVWTMRQVDGVAMATPQHGLDETTGSVALYTRVPAWHDLGNVVPEGVTDISSVLELGGIDWTVEKRPVRFRNPVTGIEETKDDAFLTHRMDTGAPLGIVGTRYEVWQNAEEAAFLQELADRYDVPFESAGALDGGSKIFVSMRLPNTVTIDAEGINDEIVPFIVAINTHDGSGKAQVVVTPWRPVCGNTERFAVRDAHSRWGVRHTRNMRDKVEEARRTLSLSVKYFDQFAAEENALARTDVEIREFEKVIADLWPEPDSDATKRTRTMWDNRRADMVARWEANAAALGRTGYAAERAITEYLDWGRNIRPNGVRESVARAAAMLEGDADDVKTRTHKRLLTLVRR